MATLPTQLPQEITNKYSIVSNAFKLDQIKNAEKDLYTNEPKDEINIEIGDTKQTEFYPQVKLCRWTNETNFSVRLKDTEYDKATVSTLQDKIIWSKGNIDIEFYDYPENEGGYKMVWYLKEKPLTNKVEFTIQSKGLDFFYQPPLTQEFQSGYSDEFKREIIVSETQVKDLEGNVLVHRPENVVGSYVFYHQTKGGMVDTNGKAYGTGQGGIIYRPKLIDAEGKEAWGDLHIENGLYTITIPQDFLDTAVYPIKSNDTFGYLIVGGTAIANGPGYTNASGESTYSPEFDGVLDSIVLYAKDSGDKGKTAIYTTADAYIDEGAEITLATAPDWKSGASVGSANVYAATTYWLAFKTNATASEYYNTTGGTTYRNRYAIPSTYANAFANPISWFTSAGTNREFSIYATYTSTSPGVHYEYFVIPGTNAWTTPAGVTSLDIECWGAGGGPGIIPNSGGGGGGGGAYAKTSGISVSAETSYNFIVGAGTSTESAAGGDSYFDDGSLVLAKGGGGATNTTGGTGGASGSCVGDSANSGGDGGDGEGSGDTSGGGGGAGGPDGVGGNGTAGNGAVGGAGGAGDAGTGGAGGTGGNSAVGGPGEGNLLGGGGGGGGDNGWIGGIGGNPGGGAGGGETASALSANGMIKITYTIAAGGTRYDATFTGGANGNTLSLVQGSLGKQQGFISNLIDNITPTEPGMNRTTRFNKTITGTLTFSDAITSIKGFLKTISNTLGLTDLMTRGVNFRKTITDAITFVESLTITEIGQRFSALLTDTIILTKETAQNLTQTITDNLNLNEIATRTTNFYKTIADAINLNETITKIGGYYNTLINNITFQDTATTTQFLRQLKTNTLSLADNITTTLTEAITNFTQTLTEIISLNEILTKQVNFRETITDTITFVENLISSGINNFTQTLTETLSLIESKTNIAGIYKTITDNITLQESTTIGAFYRIAKTEVLAMVEALTATATIASTAFTQTLTDTITFVDTTTAKIRDFFITITEELGLREILSIPGTFWEKLTKHTTAWTKQSKNTTNWNKQSKNTTTWSHLDKH